MVLSGKIKSRSSITNCTGVDQFVGFLNYMRSFCAGRLQLFILTTCRLIVCLMFDMVSACICCFDAGEWPCPVQTVPWDPAGAEPVAMDPQDPEELVMPEVRSAIAHAAFED